MDNLHMCFACGKENPIGLKLDFVQDENKVRACFTPTEVHQGYPGIMHGGLVTTLLDEAMAKVVNFRGIKAVTATLDIKFRNSVHIGDTLTIIGELMNEKQRRCLIRSWVKNADGKIMAEATSVFIKV